MFTFYTPWKFVFLFENFVITFQLDKFHIFISVIQTFFFFLALPINV